MKVIRDTKTAYCQKTGFRKYVVVRELSTTHELIYIKFRSRKDALKYMDEYCY